MRFVLLALCCCFCASGCYLDRVYRCDDCDGGVGYSGRFASLVADQRCDNCTGQTNPCRDCLRYTVTARSRHMATCGSGCQDVYFDEWWSDPPKCDPCDNHGHWTGRPDPCCKSNWATFWAQLRGERFAKESCCGGQGCSSCQQHTGPPVEWHEEPAHSHKHQPAPAKQKKKSQPTPAKK